MKKVFMVLVVGLLMSGCSSLVKRKVVYEETYIGDMSIQRISTEDSKRVIKGFKKNKHEVYGIMLKNKIVLLHQTKNNAIIFAIEKSNKKEEKKDGTTKTGE